MKRFISLWLLIPLLLSCNFNQPNKKANTKIEFTTLFKKDSNAQACFRIPAMITAPNGDILVVADDRVASCGDLRSNKDINIVLKRSSDNGNNWSESQAIIDYPLGQSASDPSMIVDRTTNTIFLFFNFMDLENTPNIYQFRYITSSDNGKTWSKPVDITDDITPKAWRQDFQFITSGRGIQTQDGKLLHTLVNLQRGCFLFASDNHGQTWYLINSPMQPADESKVIELTDGSWMVNSRVSKLGMRYIHCSKDEGKTWTSYPDSALLDPSCNASIIRYQPKNSESSYLIFSNAGDPENRVNLSLKVSTDEGKTWSENKVIYAGGTAYSSMTVLPNGNIGVVFEKDDYQEIAFTSLSLEDM